MSAPGETEGEIVLGASSPSKGAVIFSAGGRDVLRFNADRTIDVLGERVEGDDVRAVWDAFRQWLAEANAAGPTLSIRSRRVLEAVARSEDEREPGWNVNVIDRATVREARDILDAVARRSA